RLPGLPGEWPTISDWADHITTAFPEVRLKRFLEMRGADGGPWRAICALPAFWVGLLYDSQALTRAAAMVEDWSEEARTRLRHEVPRHGLKTRFRGRPLLEVARELVTVSGQGLARRARMNWDGVDETRYLRVLEEIVESGQTMAEEKLEKYRGPWAGDIDRV